MRGARKSALKFQTYQDQAAFFFAECVCFVMYKLITDETAKTKIDGITAYPALSCPSLIRTNTADAIVYPTRNNSIPNRMSILTITFLCELFNALTISIFHPLFLQKTIPVICHNSDITRIISLQNTEINHFCLYVSHLPECEI